MTTLKNTAVLALSGYRLAVRAMLVLNEQLAQDAILDAYEDEFAPVPGTGIRRGVQFPPQRGR